MGDTLIGCWIGTWSPGGAVLTTSQAPPCGLHVIPYPAILDVPRELVEYVPRSPAAQRRTRHPLRQPGADLLEALFLLACFGKQDDIAVLGTGFGISRATSYRRDPPRHAAASSGPARRTRQHRVHGLLSGATDHHHRHPQPGHAAPAPQRRVTDPTVCRGCGAHPGARQIWDVPLPCDTTVLANS